MKYYVNKETKEHSIYPYVPKPGSYEVVEADHAGWVVWCGRTNYCPVPENDAVEVKTTSGTRFLFHAGEVNWLRKNRWYGVHGDIIAYRPELSTPIRERFESDEWTGKGYPPVDTECWCREKMSYRMPWTKVIVTAYGEQNVLVQPINGSDEFCISLEDVWFGRINKEKDAEEAAVGQMLIDIGSVSGSAESVRNSVVCRRLYRAGYRK